MTRARNKTWSVLLKKIALWSNLFFLILLLLTYATPLISVDTWGWLSLLALAYPFVLLINGFFALGWAVVGNWMSLISLLTILVGFPYHSRYIKLFSFGEKPKCEESIRVVSYNLRGLSMVPVRKGQGIEMKIDSLYSAFSRMKEIPDIFCLQEAPRGELIAKKFSLAHSFHAPKSTLWLLSRFPIKSHGFLDGKETGPSCLWADVLTPQGMLRVYNLHLVSNRVTNTTEELMDNSQQRQKTWKNVRFIMHRYKYTTQKRAIEATELRQHLADCPYPAIIAGDVNDTPLSNTYHVLSRDLKDSFRERGQGLSTTYYSKLPLLRIDYLLGTSQIQFRDHYTHHIDYSDHYPVSSGICIVTPAGS